MSIRQHRRAFFRRDSPPAIGRRRPTRSRALVRLLPLLPVLALHLALARPLSPAAPPAAAPPPPATFTNPLVAGRSAADPWIVRKDGWYYFTFTAGNRIEIWKARTIAGLADAAKVTVWRAPKTGPNAGDVWAPELHFVRGKWHLYYTATNESRSDANRRVFALEAATDDPQGPYRDRGKVAVEGDDHYAIDGTIFQKPGEGGLYFLWSGRKESARGPQNIYIARMRDPWTLAGPRVLLSTPTYDWERVGWPVNEGPEVLTRGGKTFVVYSASGGTRPDYALGLLTNTGGDLLDPGAWTKSPVPVFRQYRGPSGAGVYAPGHNGFFNSPDGTEDWIVYHGKEKPETTWGGRLVRAQRFHWNAHDGSPNFGHPIPSGMPLAVPAGEAGAPSKPLPFTGTGAGLRGDYFEGEAFGRLARTRVDPTLNFDWRLDAPTAAVAPDHFSARWRGQVQPRYSETYTFHVYADDGVRLWVDGRKLVDSWENQAATASEAAVPLQAGRRYEIVLEYYEHDDRAQLLLAWNSPSQPFEVIPRSQLYPAPPLGVRGRR